MHVESARHYRITFMKKSIQEHSRFVQIIALAALIVGALQFLSSCNVASADPAGFSNKASTSVKKGMTKSQVRGILGNPVSIMTMNGDETWSYAKVHIARGLVPFGLGGQEENHVSVIFNPQGRVKNVNTFGAYVPPGSIYR